MGWTFSGGTHHQPMAGVSIEDMKNVMTDVIRLIVDEVGQCTKDVKDLGASLSRLAGKVDTQGKGYEATAQAVVTLNDTVIARSTMQTARGDALSTENEQPMSDNAFIIAAKNEEEIDEIRQHFREDARRATGTTNISRYSMLNSSRAWSLLIATVVRMRDITTQEASDYLLTPRLFPVRNKPGQVKKKRPLKPPKVVIPHLVYDPKKYALVGYWSKVGFNPQSWARRRQRCGLRKSPSAGRT